MKAVRTGQLTWLSIKKSHSEFHVDVQRKMGNPACRALTLIPEWIVFLLHRIR
jgi:hypothetical protein